MKTTMFILLSLLLIQSACLDCPAPPKPIPQISADSIDSKFDVVWSHAEDQEFVIIDGVVEYGEAVIMLIWKGFSIPAILISYDKESGDTNWVQDVSISSSGFPEFYLYNDHIIFLNSASVHSVSAVDGSTLWRISKPTGARNALGLSITSNRIFVSYPLGDKFNNDSSILYEIDEQTGNLTHILTVRATDQDGYSPNLAISKLAKLDNGNDVLIFQNRSFNWHTMKDRMDVLAYDLTADSMLWQRLALNDSYASSQSPLVVDHLFIAIGSGKLFGIDIESGRVVWEQDESIPQTAVNTSNIFCVDGNLVVTPGNQAHLNVIRASDGQLIRSESQSGRTWSHMARTESELYYTDLIRLWCHDLKTGAFLWTSNSPFANGRFSGTLFVDSETNYFYVSDNKRVMCLKLKE